MKSSLFIKNDELIDIGSRVKDFPVYLKTSTGRNVIMVLPQEDLFEKKVLSKFSNKKVSWGELKKAMSGAGILVVDFQNSNTVAIVQGRRYNLSSKEPTECEVRKLWKSFLILYKQLTPEEQLSLVSKQGISATGTGEDVSPGARAIANFARFEFANRKQPTRLRLRLVPVIDTYFPNPPEKMIKGWWESNGLDVATQVSFPDSIVSVGLPKNNFLKSKIKFPQGIIEKEPFLQEVERLGNSKATMSGVIKWPIVDVAGEVSLSDILDCLEIASVAEARKVGDKKLIYFAPSVGIQDAIRPSAIAEEERPVYDRLLKDVSNSNQVNLGAFSKGILQVQANALPSSWTDFTLGGISQPKDAYLQIGMPSTNLSTVDLALATQKWRTTYGNTYVVSLASIGLLSETEQKDGLGNWGLSSQNVINLSSQCW